MNKEADPSFMIFLKLHRHMFGLQNNQKHI